MAAVVNFYVFKFQKNKFWAFSQMGIYKKYLKNVRGLKFFRLLGTGGKTGFGLYPDFKTYCFLSVWEDDDYANHFTRKSDFFSNHLTSFVLIENFRAINKPILMRSYKCCKSITYKKNNSD